MVHAIITLQNLFNSCSKTTTSCGRRFTDPTTATPTLSLQILFKTKYDTKMVGIKSSKLYLLHFLIDCIYLDKLSNNDLRIVRHLGTYITGDRKCYVFGDSDNVRVVFIKSDRVGLWFYQLASVLLNGLTLRPLILYYSTFVSVSANNQNKRKTQISQKMGDIEGFEILRALE